MEDSLRVAVGDLGSQAINNQVLILRPARTSCNAVKRARATTSPRPPEGYARHYQTQLHQPSHDSSTAHRLTMVVAYVWSRGR